MAFKVFQVMLDIRTKPLVEVGDFHIKKKPFSHEVFINFFHSLSVFSCSGNISSGSAVPDPLVFASGDGLSSTVSSVKASCFRFFVWRDWYSMSSSIGFGILTMQWSSPVILGSPGKPGQAIAKKCPGDLGQAIEREKNKDGDLNENVYGYGHLMDGWMNE